jgi:hypothetical protein
MNEITDVSISGGSFDIVHSNGVPIGAGYVVSARTGNEQSDSYLSKLTITGGDFTAESSGADPVIGASSHPDGVGGASKIANIFITGGVAVFPAIDIASIIMADATFKAQGNFFKGETMPLLTLHRSNSGEPLSSSSLAPLPGALMHRFFPSRVERF